MARRRSSPIACQSPARASASVRLFTVETRDQVRFPVCVQANRMPPAMAAHTVSENPAIIDTMIRV